MPPSSALQWALLALPISVIIAYFLTTFPHSPEALYIHPSLATLPKSSPSWRIYPEDFYDGGAYVRLPHGTVCPSTFNQSSSVPCLYSPRVIGPLLANWSPRGPTCMSLMLFFPFHASLIVSSRSFSFMVYPSLPLYGRILLLAS